MTHESRPGQTTAFLFDLDGTLVDSVYQHVLAWSVCCPAATGQTGWSGPAPSACIRILPICFDTWMKSGVA